MIKRITTTIVFSVLFFIEPLMGADQCRDAIDELHKQLEIDNELHLKTRFSPKDIEGIHRQFELNKKLYMNSDPNIKHKNCLVRLGRYQNDYMKDCAKYCSVNRMAAKIISSKESFLIRKERYHINSFVFHDQPSPLIFIEDGSFYFSIDLIEDESGFYRKINDFFELLEKKSTFRYGTLRETGVIKTLEKYSKIKSGFSKNPQLNGFFSSCNESQERVISINENENGILFQCSRMNKVAISFVVSFLESDPPLIRKRIMQQLKVFDDFEADLTKKVKIEFLRDLVFDSDIEVMKINISRLEKLANLIGNEVKTKNRNEGSLGIDIIFFLSDSYRIKELERSKFGRRNIKTIDVGSATQFTKQEISDLKKIISETISASN